MGVRSRLLKILGGAPAAMHAGEAAAQMTPATPFSPGAPIHPHDGFQRTPRTHDFVTGYNIAARPRSHERVSFDTLRGLVEAYDVASMCIWHRIDSIRSLDWSLIAAEGYGDDVSDAIPVGMAALKKPDRDTPFATWLAEWLYSILAYDAGSLYRMRNRGGRAIGLRVVDGTTIAPLLDYWGNTPQDPAEAYVQYAQGLPWNWLTRSDLIYTPFRKVPGSPYGRAPLESILLNANTDLRFQAYFLQRFTEGNIPAAFASAPDTWTPGQIEQFQGYWDAFMLGDQAVKSQIKWLPGGGKIQFTAENDFSDQFSLFLMRKTAAAYHVVPADLGFTENVNRSSGESQADVQHRVGDLPLIKHIDGVVSSFLQDDLGLPLRFAFDLGEEQTDRYQQAQADKIYVDLGAISPSDVREMRYGLPEPDGIPVPRFVFTDRGGPIPLASLYAVAGKVDPATAAPEPGAELPHQVFGGTEGVTPSPPIKVAPLAEQIYGPSAMPPAPPPQPDAPVQKEPAAGVTAGTGITSYDIVGQHDDEDEEGEGERAELAKRELAAFRRFRQARRRDGKWRDFQFTAVTPVRAHRLNDAGRLAVRKATGEVAVAGLAVRAADTGRVLMLQRALDDTDPAGGAWEFPGGHCEGDETPLHAAWREWSEETARVPPPGTQTGSWTSPDGVYQGIVWTVDSEACVPISGDGDGITNPDDPDGDVTEAIAWWDPAQIPGNPAVRQELLDSVTLVMGALGVPSEGDESVCPCGTPVLFDQMDGWQHADGSISHDDGESVSDKMRVVKAAKAGPKGRTPDRAAIHWPGWDVDEALAAQYAATLHTALTGAMGSAKAHAIASTWLARPGGDPLGWLQSGHPNLFTDARDAIAAVLGDLWRQGWALGEHSAAVLLERATVKKAGKQGSGSAATPVVVDEDTLRGWLDEYGIAAIQGITDTRMADLASALGDAVEEGWPVARLAGEIEGFAASGADTDLIAVTELARAVSQGALSAYEGAGVSEVAWLTAPGACRLCQDNADAGPIPADSNFPSGVSAPPGHPRCRCSLQPAAISGINILNVLAGG